MANLPVPELLASGPITSKDIQYYEDYQVHGYRGSAVKMGVGVQASEIYAMAKELGFTAVGYESKSVSVAGGFVLGGGHSPHAEYLQIGCRPSALS